MHRSAAASRARTRAPLFAPRKRVHRFALQEHARPFGGQLEDRVRHEPPFVDPSRPLVALSPRQSRRLGCDATLSARQTPEPPSADLIQGGCTGSRLCCSDRRDANTSPLDLRRAQIARHCHMREELLVSRRQPHERFRHALRLLVLALCCIHSLIPVSSLLSALGYFPLWPCRPALCFRNRIPTRHPAPAHSHLKGGESPLDRSTSCSG